MIYKESVLFKGIDYLEGDLPIGEYEDCTFMNCIFTNSNLSGRIFSNCSFMNCDLSMAVIGQTSFREVSFKDCKLLGLHFNKCNQFLLSLEFERCILNFSSFYQVNLKKMILKNCLLREVDFVESNLSQAAFLECDMTGAVFNNTNLEGADLRTAYNFSIHPSQNRINKTKFSRENVSGLLDRFGIIIE